MMEKQGAFNEASHSCAAARKRVSCAANIHPCRQSQCPNVHPRSRVAQSRRRLDRPANLRGLRPQPQYLHSRATVVPGRGIGGGAARQAPTAVSPGLDRWTGGPAHCHCLQSRSYGPRPLDAPSVSWKSRRTGFRRVDFTGTHPQVAQKMSASTGLTNSGASQP